MICLEYLLLAVLFDGTDIRGAPGVRSVLAYSTNLVGVVAAGLTAVVIARGASMARAVERMAPPPVRWGWGLLHLAVYAALLLASRALFSSEPEPTSGGELLFAVWLAAGLLVIFTLWRWLVGVRVELSMGRSAAFFVAAVSFGAVCLWLVWALTPALSWLTQWTLLFSARLLGFFSATVRVDAEQSLLGIDDFSVIVAPACSGLEGMVLLGLFTAGFLFHLRKNLRFPHALLLLPLGLCLAWVANAVRIAALVAIGTWVSPQVALGGFHSKAGWLFFCGLGLGLAFLARRHAWLSREPTQQVDNPTAVYCVPLLVLIGVGMLTSAFADGADPLYPLRVTCGAVALVTYRKSYRGPWGGPSWLAVLLGVSVFGLWLALHPPSQAPVAVPFEARGSAFFPFWVAFRIAGSVVVVPVAEELAFRGFLQRRLVAVDFEAVHFRPMHLRAVLISAAAFGVLHPNFWAGTLAGVAYSLAAQHRDRLRDAVVAHAITNALLCVWVLAFDRWDLW